MYRHLAQYPIKERKVSSCSLGDIKGHSTGTMEVKGHSSWSPEVMVFLAEVVFSWSLLKPVLPCLRTHSHAPACLSLFLLPWAASLLGGSICWRLLSSPLLTLSHLTSPPNSHVVAFQCYLDFVGFCPLVSPKASLRGGIFGILYRFQEKDGNIQN